MKVKIQFGVKQIVLLCVAVVLVVILAVANYYLDYYSLIIHRFMAGDSANVTRDEGADAAVREVAAESMVLLKNDNDYLPKKDLKKVNLFGYGSTDNGFLLTGGGSGGTTILDTDAKGNARIKVDLAAIPKILTGEINPSGKMSDILPYSFREYDPTYVNATRNGDYVYQEGIYFGYKWYETAAVDGYFDEVTRGNRSGYDAVVQYPFGHGLSYTDFEWSVANWGGLSTALDANKAYEIKVRVTNIGDETGSSTVTRRTPKAASKRRSACFWTLPKRRCSIPRINPTRLINPIPPRSR